MQLADLFCYAFLMITITVCVYAEEQSEELELQSEKRISKRDASVIINGYPIEPIYRPKMIYQKISKRRYGPPSKPRYGSPRPIYGSPPISRKPYKKYRGKKPYGPPGYKKRMTTPRFNSLKSQSIYGSFNKLPPYTHYPSKSVIGFGEPPSDFEFQKLKPKYVLPPIDSYGEPIKTTINDLLTTTNTISETTAQYDNPGVSGFDEELAESAKWQTLDKEKDEESSSASKKIPSFIGTDSDLFITPVPDIGEETLKSYSDIYAFKYNGKDLKVSDNYKKKRPQYFPDNPKRLNKPWKSRRPFKEDDLLVGGQYAEPPARYFEKYQPLFSESNDFHPQRVYRDMRITARRSPYVNYKNSNMAFSPQNLNDAFSINKK